MALFATNRFAGDGATTSYEFSFVGKYIARPHVKVYQEDNATQARTPIAITDSNFLNDTTLRSLPVTPAGKTLVIYRDTPKPPLVDFTNGSRFTEYNMDLVARQGLFVAMEAMDAGGIDAREQLLATIAVVAGLVDDATATVSDATAAALAAATSASNAAASAAAAESAAQQVADNTASALASKDAAAASAVAANTSKNAAATSAANAAGSATTAATQAGNANTSATNANAAAAAAASGASAAAGSASSAAASSVQAAGHASTAQAAQVAAEAAAAAVLTAAPAKVMACKFERVHSHLCHLVGYGGNTMLIDGIARTIPTYGVSLPLASWDDERLYYVYASWSGSAITLEASTIEPVMHTTYGYETQNGVAGATLVGAFARLPIGFVDTPRARWIVSRYNQPPRVILSSAPSNVTVASGMTSPILSAWAVTLGAAVDVSGGGQASCTGYARAFVHINEVNTPGAATMQGTATVSLGHIVARTYAVVGPGFLSLQAMLHAISAPALAVGGEEAGWHLMAMLHPT